MKYMLNTLAVAVLWSVVLASQASTVGSRANINCFGNNHDAHNHPRAYLNGVHYLKIPTKTEKLKTRQDVRSGCITFYDPRSSVNMNAIRNDPYVDLKYTIGVKNYIESCDKIVEGVPMPDAVLAWMGDFVEAHHVEVPFKKRNRKPYNPRKGGFDQGRGEGHG